MGQLVSCLTVSKPDRWGLLQRAIIDFGRQTYPDRELIVAVTDARFAEQVEEFIDTRKLGEAAPVRVIQRDQRDQSGLLLHAQAASRGEYLTPWDDDNLNAPDRLAVQMEAAKGYALAVTVLGNALYHFFDPAEVFVTGFEQPNVPLSQRAAVTSMIVPRAVMPAWPHAARGYSVVSSLADLLSRQKVKAVVLPGLPYAHMIGVRGDNARGEEYHRKLATTLPLARKSDWLKANQEGVEKGLAQYTWEPAEVAVSGPDGVAFKYSTVKRWGSEGHLYPVGEPRDGVTRTTEKVG